MKSLKNKGKSWNFTKLHWEITFYPFKLAVMFTGGQNILVEIIQGLKVFRISSDFSWNHLFFMYFSFKGRKTAIKSSCWKSIRLKQRFRMGPLNRHFTPLKLNLQQKWMAPPESWWNSEFTWCLKHFCLDNLFPQLTWLKD